MNILKSIPTLAELLSIHPKAKAFFFDMDGTLCDSEHLHSLAMEMIGQQYKIRAPYPPEIVHQKLVGKADHFVFEEVKTWPGFPQDLDSQGFRDLKTKNLLALLDGPHSLIRPEMLSLLQEIRNNHFTLALVTSSERIITDKILKSSQVYDYFDFILTRDDCPEHKPHPWPYIKARELAKENPEHVIIFEDSKVGLEAAEKSGANYFKVEWF